MLTEEGDEQPVRGNFGVVVLLVAFGIVGLLDCCSGAGYSLAVNGWYRRHGLPWLGGRPTHHRRISRPLQQLLPSLGQTAGTERRYEAGRCRGSIGREFGLT